ncbi:MAG: pyridoxamine 5'-phosphate oxidase [Gemmatimonadetes bacterium]|nr:pyridoxamine 5'-phosphate oxidase [Gemmatimonadota bacterium]
MIPDGAVGLERGALADDPLVQFDRWFEIARAQSGAQMPEAACLSSVDDDGYPDGRIVLLKARDATGFVFYTNLRSVKGRSLLARPRAALTFHWETLARQVRVQGDVERVRDAEADAYFATRPRGSQIGAWASEQSTALASREALLASVADVEARYEAGAVPRPPHWSGLRIVPRRVEFWQGRPDRLHDRFVYRRRGADASAWEIERLAP